MKMYFISIAITDVDLRYLTLFYYFDGQHHWITTLHSLLE